MPHPSGQGSYFDVLAAQLSPREVQELGNALRASLPVCALFWSREGGLLPAAATVPASLPDFVVAQLCGVPPTTEPTLAAGHGALDLTSGTWHTSVLRRLGLDGLRWPAVRPTGTLVGTAAIGRARLGCHTPVADHQCALVGALVGRAELSINASTGSQVALVTDELTFGEYEVRPFFDGRHLRTVTRIPAGRALDVLVRLLAEMAEGHGARIDDPWPYVMRSAEAVGATDLHVDLGFFPNACDATGGITNLREDNASVGHVFRAAFQRMADNFHQCAARLAPPSAWDRLVFSGGLLQKSGLLRDLIARRFGTPYRMSPEPEDTLLGLLVLATAFSGRAASVTEAIVAVGAALAARRPAGVAAP